MTVKKITALLLALTLIVSFASCAQNSPPSPSVPDSSPTTTGSPSSEPLVSQAPPQYPDEDGYRTAGFNVRNVVYSPTKYSPETSDIALLPDLSNIENLDQFSHLTENQRRMLAENLFVVTPTSYEQLFYLYDDNEYKRLPSFITSDSVLHTYHMFFDGALRTTEGTQLLPAIERLNSGMLQNLLVLREAYGASGLEEDFDVVIAYLVVAHRLLELELPDGIPASALALAESELALIASESGLNASAVTGQLMPYDSFVVRGHYTLTEELGRYFKTMIWYGTACFPFYDSDGAFSAENARRAALLAAGLFPSRLSVAGLAVTIPEWESVYNVTAFFSGSADDLSPVQVWECVERALGERPALGNLTEPAMLAAYEAEIEKLPEPEIAWEVQGVNSGKQMRFMGQRYIPDSEILQRLSKPLLRPIPSGLDVFAALGSDRAAEHIGSILKPAESWPDYPAEFSKVKEKFAGLAQETWQSNLYYGWLWAIRDLSDPYGSEYPAFMRSAAWRDKSLMTSLGSWTELRRDTILYGKQSGAQSGDGYYMPVVEQYVEPNVELYEKLLWLTGCMRENLDERGLISENMSNGMQSFEELLGFLRDCSIKELTGLPLTEEEKESLRSYGGTLEYLALATQEESYSAWYILTPDERDMAVIADVHYTPQRVLEEAVGRACEIYVVVPIEGKLWLTRGAVFDYYEFTNEKRLTDQEWREMLNTGNAPDRPEWTGSFLDTTGIGNEPPVPDDPYLAPG